ncbi:PilT/PilU family type 4a pilus ATPase [Candidatus Peregrinibacteria bacterium]|nr:MAG: PilT/PilU family type 4a pilus ATPase [Candidatus Peregrinibacteria bacterium]
MNVDYEKVFDLAINQNASDIHYQSDRRPVIRVSGKLYEVEDAPIFKMQQGDEDFIKLLNEKSQVEFREKGSTDFAFAYKKDFRFRANLYRQQHGLSLSLRLVRNNILNFEQLGLPNIFLDIAENYRQGFFLFVGPTGHGKSTSLASILNHINSTREEHIITIEDPIEYIIDNKKSIIEQREVGEHTSTFDEALRGAMRQDPDVIMIGEMRDHETMQAAITLAETGHLVFSTLHTNNSVQTLDRIIDAFPEQKQKQIRQQLSGAPTGIISQRLVPGVDGKLVFAYEQLMANDAVRNIIRSEKTEQIYNALQSGENTEMVRLEQCLVKLAKDGKITREVASAYAINRQLIDVFFDQ